MYRCTGPVPTIARQPPCPSLDHLGCIPDSPHGICCIIGLQGVYGWHRIKGTRWGYMMGDKRQFADVDVRAEMVAMGQRPIAFYVAFARIAGSIGGGLMLSQATYWMQTSVVKRRDGQWFYKSQREWEEETTMTRREQEAARRKLRAITHDGDALWEEKLAGVPATVHYRINLDVLIKLVAAN